jgi:hypothetical protein
MGFGILKGKIIYTIKRSTEDLERIKMQKPPIDLVVPSLTETATFALG